MKLWISLLLLSTLLFAAGEPLAKPSITAQKCPDTTSVNNPFALEVTISSAPGIKLIPADSAGFKKTLLINAIEQKPAGSDLKILYHLAAYAPPVCTIPELSIYATDQSGKTDTLKTKPQIIKVKSIITDTGKVASAEFGDPMEAGKFPWKKLLGFIGLVILCAAILIGIAAAIRWYIMKKKNKNFWGQPLDPELPPYEEAMKQLAKIESDKMIDSGLLKETVFLLSEILKRYIGRRYECGVQEATSSEFRKWIGGSPLSREQRNLLERFIAETDPVKFAGLLPSISAVGSMFNDVKTFVIETKPVEYDDTTNLRINDATKKSK